MSNPEAIVPVPQETIEFMNTKLQQQAEQIMCKMDRRRRREIAAIKPGVVIVSRVNRSIPRGATKDLMVVSEGTVYTVLRVLDKWGTVEVMGDPYGLIKGRTNRSPTNLLFNEYYRKIRPKTCNQLLDEIESSCKDCVVLIQATRDELQS